MKNKLWKTLIITGTLLILMAVFLCLYNYAESRRSYRSAVSVLEQMLPQIPEQTAPPAPAFTMPAAQDDLFAQYDDAEPELPAEPEIEIDGHTYLGYVSIPSLGIELPVMSSWNEENLKTAPCRYTGTAAGSDLIICAHNYIRQFGPLHRLSSGDAIIFTACDGTVYRYSVLYSEEIDGYDTEQMQFGNAAEWDLTLFTCTLGGRTRVTVRAERTDAGTEQGI